MARVKLHNNQLILPDELRQALSSAVDAELDAELVEGGGVLLRPAGANRTAAWARVFGAMRSVEYVGAEPEPSEDEAMELVVEEIHALRRKNEAKDRGPR